MRITKKDLDIMLRDLNRLTNNNYYLSYAYGKVRLVVKEGNGERNISVAGTKKEVYYVMDSIVNVLIQERR